MNPTKADIDGRTAEIRRKRLQTLLASWELMRTRYTEVGQNARLHDGLAASVVEHYIQERQALISRNNIHGRIQRHKIAGLMAASIMQIRPIQLNDPDTNAARASKDNEALAVLHGLAICAETADETGILTLLNKPFFGAWFEDFVYLLSRRADSAQVYSLVFETLSLAFFPSNLARVSSPETP